MMNRSVFRSLGLLLVLVLALVIGSTGAALAQDAPNVTDPSLQIVKTTCTDSSLSGCSDGPQIEAGKQVYWRYEVKNTGDSNAFAIPKADLVIIDDAGTPGNTSDDLKYPGGGITEVQVDAELSPGETWIFKASGTARDLNDGTYKNFASVSAEVEGKDIPSDTDDSSYTNTKPVEPPVPPEPRKPVPIPEPVTVVLFGTGLAALSAAAASRRKKSE